MRPGQKCTRYGMYGISALKAHGRSGHVPQHFKNLAALVSSPSDQAASLRPRLETHLTGFLLRYSHYPTHESTIPVASTPLLPPRAAVHADPSPANHHHAQTLLPPPPVPVPGATYHMSSQSRALSSVPLEDRPRKKAPSLFVSLSETFWLLNLVRRRRRFVEAQACVFLSQPSCGSRPRTPPPKTHRDSSHISTHHATRAG